MKLKNKKMIDVKEAAAKAAEYMRSFFEGVDSVLLEEVELTEDKKYWNITLSFIDPPSLRGPSVFLNPNQLPRKYKIFKIDSETGDVLSMKIREVK